jgi:(p)ppGpp synthase/HD superfamily hydrolase
MYAGGAGGAGSPGLGAGEEVQLRGMILSMVDEPLVLVVKLADRRARTKLAPLASLDSRQRL